MNSVKDDTKLFNEYVKHVHKCSCGHSVKIYPMEHITRKICTYCGKYVYINKKEEFKDRLKERLRKNEQSYIYSRRKSNKHK